MASAGTQPEKIGEVSRLATLAAERILEAQMTERPPSRELFVAFVSAARLLEEHDVPWPPLVEQVLFEAGKRFSRADAEPPEPERENEAAGIVAGLTRFLSGFRRRPDAR
ncbi:MULTISPECIES: hypothetical protein [unclassified Methylobacterium]|uniref:hypothetical protein n=1 Tax=unclassified Methylobacterium TaxID=2615210 RepID=UPI0036FFAAAF